MGYRRNKSPFKKIFIASATSVFAVGAVISGVLIKEGSDRKNAETKVVVDISEANRNLQSKNHTKANIEEQVDKYISDDDKGTKKNQMADNEINKKNVVNREANKENIIGNGDSNSNLNMNSAIEKDAKKSNESIVGKNDKESEKKITGNSSRDENSIPANGEVSDITNEDIAGLNFSKNKKMIWPVTGNILIDYDMENLVYFATLNKYKCSDAICIQAVCGTPVYAGVNGIVTEIGENEVIGKYVTMKLGGDYEITYGQLDNIMVSGGLTVKKDDLIGYVASPTRYFNIEGDNLYIKMTEKGKSVDPTDFLNYE